MAVSRRATLASFHGFHAGFILRWTNLRHGAIRMAYYQRCAARTSVALHAGATASVRPARISGLIRWGYVAVEPGDRGSGGGQLKPGGDLSTIDVACGGVMESRW